MRLTGRALTGITSELYSSLLLQLTLKTCGVPKCYGLSGSMTGWQTRTRSAVAFF